jgi:hypothetical protein
MYVNVIICVYSINVCAYLALPKDFHMSNICRNYLPTSHVASILYFYILSNVWPFPFQGSSSSCSNIPCLDVMCKWCSVSWKPTYDIAWIYIKVVTCIHFHPEVDIIWHVQRCSHLSGDLLKYPYSIYSKMTISLYMYITDIQIYVCMYIYIVYRCSYPYI